jgi:hypothetical protein
LSGALCWLYSGKDGLLFLYAAATIADLKLEDDNGVVDVLGREQPSCEDEAVRLKSGGLFLAAAAIADDDLTFEDDNGDIYTDVNFSEEEAGVVELVG